MPINTLEKSWQFNVNNALAAQGTSLATTRRMLRLIKNAMIGFATLPWTVRYSCNGTTAGTAGDGVDRWTADADIAFQTADTGTARSWIVLRNTDGVEILIEARSASTTTGRNLRIVMSAAAGFTGGTTTTRPTATDEAIVIAGDNASTSAYGQGIASTTTDRSYAWHVLHSSDGLVTMVVLCFANAACGFWYFGRVSQPVTGWSKPVVAGVFGDASTVPSSGPNYPEMFDGTNTDANNPHFVARFPAGGARVFASSTAFGDSTAGGSDAAGRRIGTQNELSGEWELPQVGIGCAVSGFRGMSHGRLFDTRWISSGRNTGDTFPLDGSRTRACFGNIVIPWNGTSPVTA